MRPKPRAHNVTTNGPYNNYLIYIQISILYDLVLLGCIMQVCLQVNFKNTTLTQLLFISALYYSITSISFHTSLAFIHSMGCMHEFTFIVQMEVIQI